jgi:hypothetical protein
MWRRRKWVHALDDSEDLDKCELTELHVSAGTGGSGLGDGLSVKDHA